MARFGILLEVWLNLKARMAGMAGGALVQPANEPRAIGGSQGPDLGNA